MKIIVVGASGTIGKHIVSELSNRHEVISVGRNSGSVQADIRDIESIKNMYKKIGPFDALVSAAGVTHFGRFKDATDEEFSIGIQSKLMGQINLVRNGLYTIRDGGSFTLISGMLDEQPIPLGVNSSIVNGALNAFAKAAVLELERAIRINVVSPGLVEESAVEYGDLFPGHIPVRMSDVVKGFVLAVEGKINGEVIRVHKN